jgi:ABC-type multidrug transport system ATPase subunit
MRQGKILIEGTPAELKANVAGSIYELKGEPFSLLRRLALEEPGVLNAQRFGDRYHLRLKGEQSEEICAHLRSRVEQAGGRITRLHPIEAQLEDVFIALLEGESGG